MKRGFTLIELVVAISVVALVAVVVGSQFTSCIDHKDHAEIAARDWAQSMGIQVKGVACVKHDTDNDGYVSCTVSDGTKMHALECASSWSWNEGCRIPKLSIPGASGSE